MSIDSVIDHALSRKTLFTLLIWALIPLPSGMFPGQGGLIEQPVVFGIGPVSFGYVLQVLAYLLFSLVAAGGVPSTVEGSLVPSLIALGKNTVISFGTLLIAYLFAGSLEKELE